MKKVLIFADPGVDDAFAIMYAILHPEIEVVGIVAEYGNVSQEIALKNTAFLLQSAGREDIPIILGAEKPLTGSQPEYFYDIHGPHGLGGLQPNIRTPEKVHSFNKIYQLIDTYGKELIIINLSRLTSLALTFIHSESNITEVGSIIVMGGAFFVPGNRTSVAEANIYGDPQAAIIVAAHGEKVTFVPLNVSNRAIITLDTIRKIAEQNNHPFADLLVPIMKFYNTQYKLIIPGIDGAPLHDVTLFYYLINPDRFRVMERQVRVNEAGDSRGLTYADFRPAAEIKEQYPRHKIAIDFDPVAFIKDFIKIFT